ncbi:vitamin D-binding protein-like [Bombina bombina]|uniref:vitamin D-binding protein-like n=1 Tax=Bombina bombina TaxID=8345 RepID=UPI00235B2F5A|nr:vitamin D-binding protein-like [Bombina bombina]
MMKLCCAVFIFIFLLHIAEFEIYGTGFHTHDSMKNIGCELTNEIQAVFRTNALIFYSQTLVNNSLQDVNRLVKNLTVFTSNCCMEEADSGCFKNKNDILIDRACEDLLSGTKNQAISLCCDQFNAKREECFRSIQHGPPVTIPNIYTVIPFASQCMEYISDQHMFLKTHVYDFSRQYRIFPLKTMAKIILASKKIYDTCCKDSALDFCLEEMLLTELLHKNNLIKEYVL